MIERIVHASTLLEQDDFESKKRKHRNQVTLELVHIFHRTLHFIQSEYLNQKMERTQAKAVKKTNVREGCD
jgi:hypothetical protein